MIPTIEDEKHVDEVCKKGQGAETCRYLTMKPPGAWACAKWTEFKQTLDARVIAENIRARGDNCDGIPHEGIPPRTI